MDSLTNFLQGELERLFELDAMQRLSSELLGIDLKEFGSVSSKGTFARELVDYCKNADALQALTDAILLSSKDANPSLRDLTFNGHNTELKPGTQVGNLRVVKKIGEGGISTVYLAESQSNPSEKQSKVALKVFNSDFSYNRSAINRYKTASRVLQSIHIPNLAATLGVGQLEDSRPWVAAEHLPGQTLALRLKNIGSINFNDAKPLFRDILESLQAIHERGLIHGNLKPENVFLLHSASDDSDRTKLKAVLVDGCINRLILPSKSNITTSGLYALLGTAKAIAPEQARGIDFDPRSDIYAMGVLMYEVLTGRLPFEADNTADLIAKHLSTKPERPSSFTRQGLVSLEIDELILKALEKDPKDRYQNVNQMLTALERMAEPAKKVALLDQEAFQKATDELMENPDNQEVADFIEQQAMDTEEWILAVTAFEQAAESSYDSSVKLSYMMRIARIFEMGVKDYTLSKQAYEKVLSFDPDNVAAKDGMESSVRCLNDTDALLEVLLDKIESETDTHKRLKILREVASIYEDLQNNRENAFIAWVQALVEKPDDNEIAQEVERLAGSSTDLWNEALEMLAGAAQDLYNTVYSEVEEDEDEYEVEEVDIQDLQEIDQEAEKAIIAAEQTTDDALREQISIEKKHAEATQRAEELTRLADEHADHAKEAHDVAEQSIDAYEKAIQVSNAEEATEQEREESIRLGEEAERMVAAADEADERAQKMADEASVAWEQAQKLDIDLTKAKEGVAQAKEALEALKIKEVTDSEGMTNAEPVEPIIFSAADRQKQGLKNLAQLSVRIGHWYDNRLDRVDMALPYFNQALGIEPDNAAAFDGIIKAYRDSQSWPELADVLINRADNTTNPAEARNYRAEAASIIAEKLNDGQTAAYHYEMVVEQDPSHMQASKAIESMLFEQNDWPALVELLEKRLPFLEETEKLETLNDLAEIHEDRLNNIDKAFEKYQKVLELDAKNLVALKGMERIHAQRGEFEQLLQVLETQSEVVTTPKQKIQLYERIGSLQEEEFVNHAEAALNFEKIVEIDPGHENANTALARIYRQLERFEDMVNILDKHARSTDDQQRKIDLYLQSARTLMLDINAPDRAVVVCERILSIDNEHSDALDILSRLRSSVGDIPAAIEALERLAEREQDTKRKANFFIRAAKLLQESGDTEGAIIHYKNALDSDNEAIEAANALHLIYAKKGDFHATIQMLFKEINMEPGEIKKAELLSELGLIYSRELGDQEQAKEAFERALSMDATCTQAIIGLGEIAYTNEDFDEATSLFESVFDRIDKLPESEASAFCLTTGEGFLKIGDTDRARNAFKRARELSRNDLGINERLASLLMEMGDMAEAERLYDRIIRKFGEEVEGDEKVRLLLALGEAQIRAKHPKRAVETLRNAYELSPDSPDVLSAMSKAYEATGDWEELISILQLRARLAFSENESFELFVQIGDVFLEKLQDRGAAVQTYTAALEIEPRSRNLLTKLMAAYSDMKDWPRVIEVILRIAEMVDDEKQLAKYHRTVATIAHHELGRFEEAANYYEKALTNEPESEAAFTGLAECLAQNQDWERLASAYENRIQSLLNKVPNQEIARLLDTTAEIAQHRLGRIEDAAQMYEKAQEFEPENRLRLEKLREIYTSDPKRFFDRCIQICRETILSDPRHIDSYRAMRNTYTKVKRPDESWCVCQVLHFLKMADSDEEKFFKKYRLQQIPKLRQAITEKMWHELIIHPLQTPDLTAIFAAMTPAIVVSQSQALSTFGIGPEHQTNPANDPSVIARMLDYVSISTEQMLPAVYHRVNDTGGLSFVFSSPPAIGIGAGARSGGPQQALAFVAARHLSYYRFGHFIRQLVPTGTGLRAWLIAAIRMVTPQFPAPAILESQIGDCRAAIDRHLTGPQRDTLRGISSKLLENSPELDMKLWINGIDLTADRIGFILSNDLMISNAVIEASPEGSSSIPKNDRIDTLVQYSVSDQYFELRRQLGIALGK